MTESPELVLTKDDILGLLLPLNNGWPWLRLPLCLSPPADERLIDAASVRSWRRSVFPHGSLIQLNTNGFHTLSIHYRRHFALQNQPHQFRFPDGQFTARLQHVACTHQPANGDQPVQQPDSLSMTALRV